MSDARNILAYEPVSCSVNVHSVVGTPSECTQCSARERIIYKAYEVCGYEVLITNNCAYKVDTTKDLHVLACRASACKVRSVLTQRAAQFLPTKCVHTQGCRTAPWRADAC